MQKRSAHILLGGNDPQTPTLFRQALELISEKGGDILIRSSLYKSEAWGFQSDHFFLNQVVEMATPLSSIQLLRLLLDVETQLGRVRSSSAGYTSRTIDLDLLFFGNEQCNTPELILPHPRLHLRRFTLMPLHEKWPQFIHPVLQQSIQQLLGNCPDHSSVEQLT